MYIDDFIWLSNVIEKLAVKHRVTQDEAEEVFFNKPRFRFIESGNRMGEDVYAATGHTDAGRYLIVFFILDILPPPNASRYGGGFLRPSAVADIS